MNKSSDDRVPDDGMIYAPRQNLIPPEKSKVASKVKTEEYTGWNKNKVKKHSKSFRFPRLGTLFKLIIILLLIFAIGFIWMMFKADKNMPRQEVLTNYANRIGNTPGTNWLLVGTDSREKLSARQEKELSTGDVTGTGRTDTIMLFHLPKRGKPSLISIPRDLLFDIPNYGQNKVNAAYALAGPQLLVQTLEINTGVHIDHYMEIGFSGLDDLVDILGGIKVCVPYAINDPLAGVNLKAGCQKLNGKQALGFTRSRATARADLDRVQNQRLFLEAMLKKLASPNTFLNPNKINKIVDSGIKTLTFDNNDHVWDLLKLAFKSRKGYNSITVPTGPGEMTSVGDALTWNDDTSNFFKAVANDNDLSGYMSE